jgi:UDP-N-acetylglucosamine 2-epimerase (non-hydrolysing)
MWEQATSGIEIIDPVGYLDFVRLLDASERVATDSGGVQKEAFYLDTPCVTIREETEWIETIESGWNVLVGTKRDAIHHELRHHERPPNNPEPYGDGNAAKRIVNRLATRVT